jgi:transcriptional regulator GlxA family with amidase domain
VQKRTVGIFVFDDVEVLDFAGPFEVFSAARELAVTATGGLRITAAYTWADVPAIDILVIPGGFGTRALLDDAATAAWIKDRAAHSQQVTSVCTGALLLAKAGLLANRQATTHHAAYDLLASLDPSIVVRRDRRVVHDGIISSAGVSAGIDMAFDVVELLHGREVADETARYIEYPRTRPNLPPSAPAL